MSLAISEDHTSLAEVVAGFVARRDVLGAARSLLDGPPDKRPPFWDELARLGWLGLHVAEEHGGSGYGLPELCIVVEELGRAVAPGPFVPTVIASALLGSVGGADDRLAGLADGSATAGVGLGGTVTVEGSTASGDAGTVVGAATADLLLVPAGDDVVLVDPGAAGVVMTERPNFDPMRPSATVTLDGAAVTVLPGARQRLLDLARLLFAAEATGIARATTEQAAEYAKVREQFGRVIATFQAVKHHCANMFVEAEAATALVWDAGRAAAAGGDAFSYAAAMAASVALPPPTTTPTSTRRCTAASR